MFWMFLKPGTITGLRHEWTHPAFEPQPLPTNESEKWLREFADRWNFDWNKMIGMATSGPQKYGNYVVAQGIDLHSAAELKGDDVLFWQHLERFTGRTFDQKHKDDFIWSCSC
jgi:hypothetical protein